MVIPFLSWDSYFVVAPVRRSGSPGLAWVGSPGLAGPRRGSSQEELLMQLSICQYFSTATDQISGCPGRIRIAQIEAEYLQNFIVIIHF